MRVYPDPSIIIAAFVNEPNSAVAAGFLKGLHPGDILTSWWAHTEITSALGVKARAGGIGHAERPIVLAAIRKALRRTATMVVPRARDFEVAADLMDRCTLPLRGGDALHLAIAAHHDATLWTFDRKMAAAGQAQGLAVRLLT